MFRETPIRIARRRSFQFATGIAVTGAILVFGSGPVDAAGGAQLVTGATGSGILSITAPSALTLPTLVAGSSTAAINLGSVSWTDTMNDSVVSSVTLTTTNLWEAAGAGLYIPLADFTITVGPTPTPNAMNRGTPAVVPAGSPYVLAGTATADFATFSTPITLATTLATSEGTRTQATNQISIAVPTNTTPGTTFAATIQYTVTGLTQRGYGVLSARSGEGASALMDGHHGVIHLLLTDVVMSGETGKEIAERVSKLRPGIRVLYMSGYPESVIASQGIIEPGITLLSKPFRAVDLLAHVRVALDA